MNKEKCFIIDEKILYVEKVLVDFENIPIFFLCKSYDDYYVVLCVDFDNYNYIIVEASLIDIYNLFLSISFNFLLLSFSNATYSIFILNLLKILYYNTL